MRVKDEKKFIWLANIRTDVSTLAECHYRIKLEVKVKYNTELKIIGPSQSFT